MEGGSCHRDEALGTWGAVQATSAGVGVALAGIVRDVIVAMSEPGSTQAYVPYNAVFAIEILFLVLACAMLLGLSGAMPRTKQQTTDIHQRSTQDTHSNAAEAS